MNSTGTPSGQLVLIVDDNAENLKQLQYNLERQAYRVIKATNGQEALSIFKQAQPDIILLDAVMPVMDGFETCRRLRNLPEGQTIPILMLTSLIDNDSVEKAYDCGITEFISKPIQWAVL